MDKGWICLYRQVQDCWIWKDKPFAKGQAWIDLLLLANHKPAKIPIDGKPVLIERGQFHTSIYKLSERWGWNRKTVSRFLNVLENDRMVTQSRTAKGTTLTIENYEVYQDLGTTVRTTVGTTVRTTEGAAVGTQTTMKQLNNETKDIDNVSIKPQEVVDSYNRICTKLPKVISLSDARKRAIKARLNSHSLEELESAFNIAETNEFLNGTSSDWIASFDWLMKEPNLLKVLEGNYKQHGKSKRNSFNEFTQNQYDFDALEKELTK